MSELDINCYHYQYYYYYYYPEKQYFQGESRVNID